MNVQENAVSAIDAILLNFVANARVAHFEAGELFPDSRHFYPEGWYVVIEGVGAYPVRVEGRSVDVLRHSGHAVIIWTPQELQGVNPRKVEDRSIELGYDIIEDLK